MLSLSLVDKMEADLHEQHEEWREGEEGLADEDPLAQRGVRVELEHAVEHVHRDRRRLLQI